MTPPEKLLPDEIWAFRSEDNSARWHSQPNIQHDRRGAKYLRADLCHPSPDVQMLVDGLIAAQATLPYDTHLQEMAHATIERALKAWERRE